KVTSNNRQGGQSVASALRQNDYSHIYPIIGLPKERPTKWVAIDATLPGGNRYAVEAPHGKSLVFPA
ncbi:hypothetical protein LCGC14_2119580, partial [marine sediment metagenome]